MFKDISIPKCISRREEACKRSYERGYTGVSFAEVFLAPMTYKRGVTHTTEIYKPWQLCCHCHPFKMTPLKHGCLILLNTCCLNSSLLVSLPCLLHLHLRWKGLRRKERRQGRKWRMYKLRHHINFQSSTSSMSMRVIRTRVYTGTLKLKQLNGILPSFIYCLHLCFKWFSLKKVWIRYN